MAYEKTSLNQKYSEKKNTKTGSNENWLNGRKKIITEIKIKFKDA